MLCRRVENTFSSRMVIVFDIKDVKQEEEEKVINNIEARFVVFKLSCSVLTRL